jgi:Rod binding domain-containing protein
MIADVSLLFHMNQTNPVKALDKVCKEFETLFAHQILKTMAESIPEGMMEEGLADDMYKDMLYMEVARSVGESGALGIGEILKRHIQERFGEDGKSSPAPVKADTVNQADSKQVPEGIENK